jgi:hypothetical protein
LVPEVGIPSLLQEKLTDTGFKPRGILSPYHNLRRVPLWGDD